MSFQLTTKVRKDRKTEPDERRFPRSEKPRDDRYWHSLLSFKQGPVIPLDHWQRRGDCRCTYGTSSSSYMMEIEVTCDPLDLSLQHPSRQTLNIVTCTGTCDGGDPDDDRRPAPGTHSGPPRCRVEVCATPPFIGLLVPNHSRQPTSLYPSLRTITDTRCVESVKRSSPVLS